MKLQGLPFTNGTHNAQTLPNIANLQRESLLNQLSKSKYQIRPSACTRAKHGR
jgi:hypothetical protein